VEEIVNSSTGRIGVNALYLVCQPILLLPLKLAIDWFVKGLLLVASVTQANILKLVLAIPLLLSAQLTVK